MVGRMWHHFTRPSKANKTATYNMNYNYGMWPQSCHAIGHKKILTICNAWRLPQLDPSQTAERPGLMPNVSAGKEAANGDNFHACMRYFCLA